ncbi:hypothetical protein [uncultured Nevskia sp.]|uniref:hypothetical protein n=1 Tax=uncultured Nevskia sp. TaxID=228950 RepID=UPI0025E602AE|nr:hypothetical protein [uncultured Nevskia sp.]
MKRILKLAAPVAVVLAALMSAGPAAAEMLTRPGFFSVDVEGWEQQPGDNRVIFACKDCGSPVQIQIDYGPELPKEAEYQTNDEFLARLKKEDAQRQFASLLIEQSVPDGVELKYDIQKTSFSKVGGLKVFEYSALIATAPRETRDSTIIGLQHHRLMKLTLNHYDDALTPEAGARISAFFKSLKFLM